MMVRTVSKLIAMPNALDIAMEFYVKTVDVKNDNLLKCRFSPLLLIRSREKHPMLSVFF